MTNRWNEIGEVLEQLCDEGLFPGIGYDINGWEAWVFLDNPVQGLCGEHVKATGGTALEAMASLQKKLKERNEI